MEPEIQLESFHVSSTMGFVLDDPKTDLPEYYQPWMSIAMDLPQLIQTHQLQHRVHEMPLLSTTHLQGHREERLAHLTLGFITMGYVWQEGEHQPVKTLPRQLAEPYCKVSEALDLPPILVYADCVLANWKLRDPTGPFEIGNMDTIFKFPGKESCRGFFLVSLVVEQAACTGMEGIAMTMNSMLTQDNRGVHDGLEMVNKSLLKMKEMFGLMRSHVKPDVFYGTLRIFFTGWMDNPALPDGLCYEGLFTKQLRGGSAAQSSSIQCFDALLGVKQVETSADSYLKDIRNYMPPAHRHLIEVLESRTPLRSYVENSGEQDLIDTYDKCVKALAALRCYHLQAVSSYVSAPSKSAHRGNPTPREEKGTGGTDAFRFLKSVRDSTNNVLISPR
ncbi:indoleamine 2,3-dioxygenase 2-like isoform X10 [Brienomyrus brachyistius]|uniref:indoleamine 2,3-dioxygenase 2-like isoform X10 n=1 Tax=Brienomyrus brachyistius TaxID=42636 RepID=UPI0020B22452|nr:indoleamine 2,3-dioxygenase 2-like isoform X10 [Brienomyrus brachyistius]